MTRFYALFAVTLLALGAFVASAAVGHWQSPGTFENGDKPPAWADAWSMAQFGHPVEFGGDEATPMEWMMKPYGFKGYAFRKDNVDIYIRLHESSAPPDRGKRYHSYEIYARDSSGAVSFWQGWLDRGDVSDSRFTVCPVVNELQPARKGTPHGWVTDGCGREEWYTRAQNWQWDIVTVINDASTIPTAGETADTPQAQWHLTGQKGVRRQIFAYYYTDNAVRYPTRNSPTLRGWFCATPLGIITNVVDGPGQCATGTLPQFVSPSMTNVETATAVYRTYSSVGIQVPN